MVSPLRILVVDDEINLLYILSMHFTSAGFLCDAVRSADEALDLLKQKKYDLVLSDLTMPGMDGNTLARTIRSDLQQQVPIVILTGFLSNRSEIFDGGVQGVLSKPIHAIDLLECAREFTTPKEQRLAKKPLPLPQ